MTATAIPLQPTDPRIEIELADLIARARSMWDREPSVGPEQREAIVSELIDVDLQLQRISLRARWSAIDADDAAQLDHCSHRLHQLQCHWVPS